jgi:hypothetical protein
MQLGFGFLFLQQVIGFAAEYRKASVKKLSDAINDTIADCHKVVAHPTQRKAAASRAPPQGSASSSGSQDVDAAVYLQDQFIAGVSDYQSVQAAWDAFDVRSKGMLSRSDFKSAIHKTLGLVCSDAERKQLRAKMDPQKTTRITFESFVGFVNSSKGNSGKQREMSDDGVDRVALPMDVPALPDR